MFCEDAARGSHSQVQSKAEMDSSHGEVALETTSVAKKEKEKIDLPCCPRAVRVGVCFIFSSSGNILFFTLHFIDSDIKFEALTFE